MEFDLKKAFTMIELVFVLVVIGILAAVIIPNTRTNPVREAAIQLQSAIRYTQHLALVEDKYASSPTWYRNLWQIRFSGTNNNLYTIVSENNTRFATDPQNPSENLQNIELRGVSITAGGSCAGESIISFDNMGRPLVGPLAGITTPYTAANLMDSNCTLVLSDGGDNNSTITIVPETGFAKLTHQ